MKVGDATCDTGNAKPATEKQIYGGKLHMEKT
jgi:hypothetical protein